jgi:hypothetical protein
MKSIWLNLAVWLHILHMFLNGTMAIPQTMFPQTTFPWKVPKRPFPECPFPEQLFPKQIFRPNLTNQT